MSSNVPNSEGNRPHQRENQEQESQGRDEEPLGAAAASGRPGVEVETAGPLAAAMPLAKSSASESPSSADGVQSLMKSTTREQAMARLRRDSNILNCLPDAVS